MPNRSPEVDAYIAAAAPFARPILEEIRAAFHAAGAEVTEVMKWRVPHFEYKGVLGSMAAFKNHVRWGFWSAKLMSDPAGILELMGETSIGGGRLTDVAQLPPRKVLVQYVREAIALNEGGAKLQRAPKKPVEFAMPEELAAALKKNRKAAAAFQGFPPSHQREYAEWIAEAKQPATRDKRIAQAVEWIAEGKPRNWKYMKK